MLKNVSMIRNINIFTLVTNEFLDGIYYTLMYFFLGKQDEI